ncbi:MAG: SDR family oxidoreductase [Chloroflexota bacterium]
MRLQGKVAIVTGAGTGIGKGIATVFAQEGAQVVVDYVGAPDAAQSTVDAITAAGGKAMAVSADVTKAAEVDALIAAAVSHYGRLDIFVNNAGVEKKMPFVETPEDYWDFVVAVNLKGPFLCSKAAARQMIAQGGGGRIINISSVHEDLPMPTNAPYCATKGGLRMLMRTICVELAPHGITVNNIGPGAIDTPMDAPLKANPAEMATLLAEIPVGRMGQPQEVGALATYLASDDAGYVTGSTFFIDGGMLRNAGSL